ncbi:MAG: hypothetical protein EXS35_04620 [Pedosphaera sp.]|nr:hypothetical protein [Pedosphaera sp.]
MKKLPLLRYSVLVASAITSLSSVLQREALAQPSNATPFRVVIERANQPQGPFTKLPASGLPLSADGDGLVDNSSASGAYYRLRTENPLVAGGTNPIVVRFGDVPLNVRNIAQEFLDSSTNAPREDSLFDVVLGPTVTPLYNPAFGPAPAYFEFKLTTKAPAPANATNQVPLHRNRDRGYIVVSASDGDFPVVSHAFDGLAPSETLGRAAGTSLLRLQRYDAVHTVAEDLAGNRLTFTGYNPVQYPNTITQYVDQVFSVTGTNTNAPPPFTGSVLPNYAAFKNYHLSAPQNQIVRSRLKKSSAPRRAVTKTPNPPVFNVAVGANFDVLLDRHVTSVTYLTDREDGPPANGTNILSVQALATGLRLHGNANGGIGLLVDSDLQSEQLIVVTVGTGAAAQSTGWSSWTYYYAGSWSDQRQYYQYVFGSCYVGCGPVDWAMLYGWFDYTGASSSLIAGGAAPINNDANVTDCIEYCNSACGTYCLAGSGATNPWDMPGGDAWASHKGVSYTRNHKYSVVLVPTSSIREHARDSIRYNNIPSMIGIGLTSAHYPLAYGYKTRHYDVLGVTISYDRYFKCNMGWGGTSASWEDASVWYASKDTVP